MEKGEVKENPRGSKHRYHDGTGDYAYATRSILSNVVRSPALAGRCTAYNTRLQVTLRLWMMMASIVSYETLQRVKLLRTCGSLGRVGPSSRPHSSIEMHTSQLHGPPLSIYCTLLHRDGRKAIPPFFFFLTSMPKHNT